MSDVTDIVNRLSRSDAGCGNVEVFVFGSVRSGDAPHSDVDLLVVYQNQQELGQVREIFEEMDFKHPLDVIYMSPSEERELAFISGQECLKIFPR